MQENLKKLPLSFQHSLINEILEIHELLLPLDKLHSLFSKFFLTRGLTEEVGQLPVGVVMEILKADSLPVKSEDEVARFLGKYSALESKLTDLI